MGDPLPPVRQRFASVQDLQLVQVGLVRQLRFSLPAGQIGRVEVYRHCGGGGKVEEERRPFLKLRRAQLSATGQGRFQVEDDSPQAGPCQYALRFAGRGLRRSLFSNRVESLPLSPARPPLHLRYQVQKDSIRIQWDPPAANMDGSQPARVLGYLVNSSHFVAQPRFEDRDFHFGEKKSYQIQTVSRRRDPLILSEPGGSLTLVPQDVFPPAAPRGLSALEVGGKIRLLWLPNSEKDLAGYYVYRATDPAQFKKSSPLVAVNDYLDAKVARGHTYYYQVSAQDRAGNESPPSGTVTIRLP